jgi:slime mold repeat-containing protein
MCSGDPSCRSTLGVIGKYLPVLAILVLLYVAPAAAQIDQGPACDPNRIDSGCNDNNPCTVDTCDAATRTCKFTALTCATDSKCSTGTCNPSTGQCVFTPVTCQQDSNLCTTESCNPTTGACESSAPKSCAIDSPCTTGSCNPSTGSCEFTPVTCQQDGDLCTTESCNPTTGQCQSGTPKSCAGDSLCSTGSCDSATGDCKQTPVTCNQDSDKCTTEVCDPSTGNCHSVPANPTPTDCGATICRTPGFWGTHAGTEKAGSSNITQAVITAGGGVLTICGQPISNTVLSDDDSAVEAICVSTSDGIRFQLARQLTSAALNCIVSNGVPDCTSTPLYSTLFSSCNAICANSSSSSASMSSCVSQLDCLNNGGKMLANGFCQTGTCASDGVTPCKVDKGCSDLSVCEPLDGNCHDQLMVNSALGFNFEPPGNAGSSTECNSAIKNGCKVIGSAQSKCQF